MNRYILGCIIAGSLAAPSIYATDYYVSGSYGVNMKDDSFNDGDFSSAFTTGSPPSVPGTPLTIPAGGNVDWDSEFDDGNAFSLAVGHNYGQFRIELEYSYTDVDVDEHNGVNAGGLDLTNLDAAILLTGVSTDLGITVGQLVADGKGEIETEAFFINGYYDFDNDSHWTPYLGVGIGYANVDVNFEPSNVEIIDDDDDVFMWQAIAGLSYSINEQLDVFGSLRYRSGDDAEVSASLLPAKFDIEVESEVTELGLRYHF